jgi:hypothetical protein
MRIRSVSQERKRIGVLVLLLISAISQAQTAQPPATQSGPPVRDPAAVTALQLAVNALGASPTTMLPSCVGQGNMVAAAGGISGPVRWENAGPEFRYEVPAASGTRVLVSGYGRPAILEGGHVTRLSSHVSTSDLPVHLAPYLLSIAINDTSHYQVSDVSTGTDSGRHFFAVTVVLSSDWLSSQLTKRAWHFDATTMLPYQVDYLLSDNFNALNTIAAKVLVSDYHNIAGTWFPFHIVTFVNGQQVTDVTLASMQCNVAIPPNEFGAPSGGQP